MRLQQHREQSDGLLLSLCASIGVWVAEPTTERVGERVTEPVFFSIVEQSAAPASANLSSAATDFCFRCVVYGHRQRLLRP